MKPTDQVYEISIEDREMSFSKLFRMKINDTYLAVDIFAVRLPNMIGNGRAISNVIHNLREICNTIEAKYE